MIPENKLGIFNVHSKENLSTDFLKKVIDNVIIPGQELLKTELNKIDDESKKSDDFLKKLDKKLEKRIQAFRDSERLSEKDFNIRINV